MGKESAAVNGKPIDQPIQKAAGGQKDGGQDAGRKSSPGSNTAGEQTAGEQGIGEIRIIGAAEGEKLSQVAAGIVPEPKKQGKRKAPEAPKGSKQQAAKVTEAATAHTAHMMAAMIKTVSDICGIRPGMEHWRMSQAEAEAIAKPAAEIMAKHSLTDKASEYADYIALIVAVGVAIVPRVMYQMERNKSTQPGVITRVQPVQPKPQQQPAGAAKPDAGTRDAHRRQDDGGAAQHGQSAIKQLLTPIVG